MVFLFRIGIVFEKILYSKNLKGAMTRDQPRFGVLMTKKSMASNSYLSYTVGKIMTNTAKILKHHIPKIKQ